MAQLVVREGKNPGFSLDLPDEGKVTMGRRSSNDLQVLDEKASRVHAEVYRQGGSWFVRDLKSRNGLKINDRDIENEVEIQFGDRIVIGDTSIELVDESAFESIDFEIPGYDLQEKIGEGAMGSVYRARQVSMDRVVALKVLNEKYNNDNTFIDRFIREARSAGRLNHPNVIHVHDVNKAGGRHYFSMEFVDGRSISQMLRVGKLDVDKSLDIALQSAKALEFAHENQIIHRDVKPDNIMLSSDGIVKLADLGIAKSFDEGQASGAKRVFGTPHYMAPEQALGKAIDARVDIYALGATLYHLFTGETPFKGENATEVLKAHIQDSLRPVRELSPEVPESAVRIVERMMAKAPEKRYESMTSLIEDIESVVRDREVEIEPLEEGASSILPSVKTKADARKKGEAKAPRKSRGDSDSAPGLSTPVKIGVVAGILVLAGAVFAVIVIVLGSPPENGDDPDNGGVGNGGVVAPEGDTAATLLQKGMDLEAQDDLDGALAVYNDLVGLFEDSPEADQAARRAEAILVKKAMGAEAAPADDLKAADDFANASPDDLAGQRARYAKVAADHPGTDEATTAQTKVTDIDSRLAAQTEEKARDAYRDAKRLSDDRYLRSQLDAAVVPLEAFVARYSTSAMATTAKARIAQIKKRASDLFADAKSDANRFAARSKYGQAITRLERFVSEVGSKEHQGKATLLKGDIDKKAGEDFAERAKDPNAKAASFRFDDAISSFRSLQNTFRGTKWQAFAKARGKAVEGQKMLHADVIKRINEAKAKKAYKELPWRLKSFPRQKFFVTEASESSVTLMGGRNASNLTIAQPKRWNSLDPKQLYQIIMLYYPTPTPKEDLWLAYFCQDHDLTDEADAHFDKAEAEE